MCKQQTYEFDCFLFNKIGMGEEELPLEQAFGKLSEMIERLKHFAEERNESGVTIYQRAIKEYAKDNGIKFPKREIKRVANPVYRREMEHHLIQADNVAREGYLGDADTYLALARDDANKIGIWERIKFEFRALSLWQYIPIARDLDIRY